MRARAIAILITSAAAFIAAPPIPAQDSLPRLETIEVTEPLHTALARLQENWLEWLTAYHRRDADRAGRILTQIETTMEELHIERIADLSHGAAVSAVQAARASDFERARWALEAAERLDRGRPENSFAAARIARLRGRQLAALGLQLQGYSRVLSFPWERSVLMHNVGLWGLYVLSLTAALFVALLASTKAPRFYRDLASLFEHRLSPNLSRLTALAILFFPLLLPNGLVWLIIYWTIVLWGYCSRSERVVVACVWLLLGLVPVVASEQRRRIALLMSSPVRVMGNLALARLEGSMLTDLGDLRLQLPESVAVKELMADVHRRLGQWEFARALYLDIVDAESENAAAMLNLGAFYYQVGDLASAIQLFQRASGSDPVAAEAYFNLSQAYSASYLFGQSRQELQQARQLDDDGVSAWVNNSEEEPVVTVDGGLVRRHEMLRELREAWETVESTPSLWRRLLTSTSLGLALVAAVLAIGVEALARRKRFYRVQSGVGEDAGGEDQASAGPLSVVPGMSSAMRGRGGRTFLALLIPVSLLTLPVAHVLGYRVPWGYDPGVALVWLVAGLGLFSYVGWRVVAERRG